MTPSRKNPVPKRVNVIADTPKQPATAASVAIGLLREIRDADVVFARGDWHISQRIAAFLDRVDAIEADAAAPDVDVLAEAMYFARWGDQWTPGKAQDRLYRKEARTEAERVIARLMRERQP